MFKNIATGIGGVIGFPHMKILLISLPVRKSDGLVVPLGICYVAADLAGSGHEVHIYDPNVSTRDFMPELRGQLDAKPYDVVGVSLRNIDNNSFSNPCYYYPSLAPALALIRKRLPEARILIGGSGFSIFPEVIMSRHREIDFGVFREGVGVTHQLLDNLTAPDRIKGIYYREGDAVRFSGNSDPPDLDAFPDFPWQRIDLTPYLRAPRAVGIVSKAGCVFQCAYCTYPRISGSAVRMRAPQLVVNDIERFVRHHALMEFFFADSIFNYPPEHARAICEEILRRQIRVKWRAFFIEKHMDRSLMGLAVKAGCSCFMFSPDGITCAALEALQKVSTEEDIRRTVDLVKQCKGAQAIMEYMVNPPKQSDAGLYKLIRIYASTKLLRPRKFLHIGGWYPRVYPNTPLHAHLIQHESFPKTEDQLLPPTDTGLKRMFWVNKENANINLLYDLYFMPQKIKNWLFGRETRHEAKLFHSHRSESKAAVCR